jgi:arylsulfatase A-like enzyme
LIAGAIEPSLHGKVVEAAVETRSLARTLALLAGADGQSFGGVDLLDAARTGRAPPALTEGSQAFGADVRKVAVVLDGWKLIHDLDRDRFELYSLERDPDERDDRWGREPAEGGAPLEELRRELTRHAGLPRLEPQRVEFDADRVEKLRELGYAR